MVVIDQATFDALRKIVYDKSGITLGDSKVALVSARVAKRLRALGMATPPAYLDYLRKDESGEEMVAFLDVISTNVTSFYREANHFVFLREKFSEWLDNGQSRFRFWCAAASSGEEPYTIAMTLHDVAKGRAVDMKLLATDISTKVLTKCIQGEYEASKLGNVPNQMRLAYFDKIQRGELLFYKAKEVLRRMLVVKRLNLSVIPFPMKGPLDIVFCRNVMIYFDKEVRTRLVNEVYRLLKPGGYLIVGHSESLAGIESDFKPVVPSVYLKK